MPADKTITADDNTIGFALLVSDVQNSINVSTIMDRAINYGIVAESLNLPNNCYTNFATKDLNIQNQNSQTYYGPRSDGIDVVPNIAANVNNNGQPLTTEINQAANYYVTDDDKGKVNSTNQEETIVRNKNELEDRVEIMINNTLKQAEDLATRSSIVLPSGLISVDVSPYGENATIIIDATNISGEQNGFTIVKRPGQTIVFNINGQDAAPPQNTKVKLVDENGQQIGHTYIAGDEMRDAPASDGNVWNKIIWNFPEATSVTATNQIGGIFLVPKGDFNAANEAGAAIADQVIRYSIGVGSVQGAEQTQTSSSGTLTLSLKGGETLKLLDLPYGTQYTIEESNLPQKCAVAFSGDTSDVAKGIGRLIRDREVTATNTYSDDPGVPITAHKDLVNGILEEGQFTYKLVDGNGRLVRQATNDANGNILFGTLVFNQDGEYDYRLFEVVDLTMTDVVFDTRVFDVHLVVQGGRVRQVKYNGSDTIIVIRAKGGAWGQGGIEVDSVKVNGEELSSYTREEKTVTLTYEDGDYPVFVNTLSKDEPETVDFEFSKEWHDLSDQVVSDWPQGAAITVTLQRKIGAGGTAETVGNYQISKTASGFDVASENDAPAMVNTDGFTFRVSELPASGTIGADEGEYVYFVTESPVPGYRAATYSNPTTTAPVTWTPSSDGALNGGKIINSRKAASSFPRPAVQVPSHSPLSAASWWRLPSPCSRRASNAAAHNAHLLPPYVPRPASVTLGSRMAVKARNEIRDPAFWGRHARIACLCLAAELSGASFA